jgi:phage-related protein
VDIAAAVSEAFGVRLGNAIGDAGARFGTFLSGLAASGRAVELVSSAATVFQQLGTIAGNVGGIISGVFKAANDAGGGLLDNLALVTGKFEEFVKSAQGQESIGDIFKTLSTVAAQLGPIFSALVTQVGAIAPALAPVFETLGPALVGLINALGPALAAIAPALQSVASGLSGAFAAIGPALGPVGEAIGGILEALSPLLPVIGQIVAAVGGALAPVLSALAAALAPVVTALADALTPVLPPLTAAFTTLAAALTPLITLIGSTLGQVIQAVAPLLTTLATVFQQIATAMTPVIEQLTSQLAPVFAQLTPLISQLVTAIAPLIQQLVAALLPVLPPIIEAFLAIQLAVIQVLPPLIQLATALAPFVSLMIAALAPVNQFAAEIIKWIAINAVVPVIQNVVGALTSIISVVVRVLNSVRGFVTSVVGFFISLRASVVGAVAGLVASVVGFFLSLPGRARGAVSSIVGLLTGVFSSAKAAVISQVTSLVTSAVSLVRSLPGRARAALGGVSGLLRSAGADLIRGFIEGVKSQAGAIASAAKSVVSGAISSAKSALGIASPSKVFAEIGKFTGQGFIKGLLGTEADIKRAAESVIGKIREAFKGKNTRLDDQLVASVQRAQKQLIRLAEQREAIAEKIKKANELAVSVSQAALSAFSLQNLARDGGGIRGLTDGIESAITKIQKFNSQVNALAKRGLRKDLLSQIIGLGPDQGADLANALSRATGSQLEDLNEAQKQLAAASKKLGRDSADNLFDAGKQASKGFLAGLKDQQEDIEDLMLSIARAMARSIRNALGIRSPSKVFRDIGRFTMDGLSNGVEDRLNSVRRSVLGAASAVTDPFGGSSSLGSIGVTSGGQAAVQGRNSVVGRSQVNNIVINEVSDGQEVVNRLMARLALAGGGL